MSWVEKIHTELVITTGDGKNYTPNWMNAGKSIEYNIAEFDFKELRGTLVDRGEARGAKYPLEIYFQGEDHLAASGAFEVSAADKRPWKISHPYYGNITVQPAGLDFDNSGHNVTKITGTVIETLLIDGQLESTSQPDKIIALQNAAANTLLNTTVASTPELTTSDKTSIKKSITDKYNAIASKIRNAADSSDYFKKYNEVLSVVNKSTSTTVDIFQSFHDISVLPYQFIDSIIDRIGMFRTQFDLISENISNLFGRTSKKIYENDGAMLVSGMALTSITNIGKDYENVIGVLPVIEGIIEVHNLFLSNLDSLQTANGGEPDSYIPDADSIIQLSQLIDYTVNALLAIASESKQERSIILESDSNLILLTQRLYGLDADDAMIDKIISTNNITLNEIVELKKGRKIFYYI